MKKENIRSRSFTFGVAAVLLFCFSVPLIFILYGGAGGVVGGAVMLTPINDKLVERAVPRNLPKDC